MPTTRLRGGPSKAALAPVVAPGASPVFAGAPLYLMDQGKMVHCCPDFSYMAPAPNGSTPDIGLIFPGCTGGWFVQDGITGGGHVVDGKRFEVTTNNTAANDSGITFSGGLTASGAATGCEPFLVGVGTDIRFYTKAKIEDISACDVFLGLSDETDNPFSGINRAIAIRMDAGVPTMTVRLTSGSVTDVVIPDHGLADDTYFEAGFVLRDNTDLWFYWNGTWIKFTNLVNLPVGTMCAQMIIRTLGATNEKLTVESFLATAVVT